MAHSSATSFRLPLSLGSWKSGFRFYRRDRRGYMDHVIHPLSAGSALSALILWAAALLGGMQVGKCVVRAHAHFIGGSLERFLQI